MAITLVRNQLVDSIINENKLDSGAVSFAKMKSADLETNLASSASASKLATAAAIKAYVDAQVPDTFQGGNGIDIDSSGDPDVISVDLATNPGLQFTSNKLDVKVKSESGGSITKDANGLYIADSAIGNAKLANSTISGKALGANLDSLSAGQGISMSAYNGSAAVSDLTVQLDGSTLAKSGSGVKVADLGIGEGQLAGNAVTITKFGMRPYTDDFAPNGSAATFTLSQRIPASSLSDFAQGVRVYRNGQRLLQKASSPADSSEYTVTDNGSATVVTLGANPANGEIIIVDYWV
jgi:hypothetical protein|tara:strand:- start:1104 stop:1985 length:882 start_codon:yes stop_codon:yes gene_type:complete